MAFASLGLTDFPPVGTLIIGIPMVLLPIVAYEKWRIMRRTARSGHNGAASGRRYPEYCPWLELSPRMRALRVSLLICCAVTIISMGMAGFIETIGSMRQPKIADAEYVHPHIIKGVVRYFTDRQEAIYAVAKPLMIGFGAAFFTLLIVLRRAEEDWRERKQRDSLDRIATEM